MFTPRRTSRGHRRNLSSVLNQRHDVSFLLIGLIIEIDLGRILVLTLEQLVLG